MGGGWGGEGDAGNAGPGAGHLVAVPDPPHVDPERNVGPGLRVDERGTPLTGGDLEGYDIALDRGGAGGEGGERERVVDRAVEVDDERTVLVRHAEVEGPPRGGGLPVRRIVEIQLEPGLR